MRAAGSPVGVALFNGPCAAGIQSVVVSDFELTDEQITSQFTLLSLGSPTVPAYVAERRPQMEKFAKSAGKRIAFARWSNGVESVLCFGDNTLQPLPEQLLRAYKNAFAARLLFTQSSTADSGVA